MIYFSTLVNSLLDDELTNTKAGNILYSIQIQPADREEEDHAAFISYN